MPAPIDPIKIQRYALYRTRGLSITNAYDKASPSAQDRKRKSTAAQASAFNALPEVQEAVKVAMKGAQIADLLSQAEWLTQTIDLKEHCIAKGNLNAAAGANRQLGQATGALRDRVVIDHLYRLEDSALIERLAGGDQLLTITLQRMIGKTAFTQDVVSDDVIEIL